jgi:hypothetical protein
VKETHAARIKEMTEAKAGGEVETMKHGQPLTAGPAGASAMLMPGKRGSRRISSLSLPTGRMVHGMP